MTWTCNCRHVKVGKTPYLLGKDAKYTTGCIGVGSGRSSDLEMNIWKSAGRK